MNDFIISSLLSACVMPWSCVAPHRSTLANQLENYKFTSNRCEFDYYEISPPYCVGLKFNYSVSCFLFPSHSVWEQHTVATKKHCRSMHVSFLHTSFVPFLHMIATKQRHNRFVWAKQLSTHAVLLVESSERFRYPGIQKKTIGQGRIQTVSFLQTQAFSLCQWEKQKRNETSK